MTLHDYNIEILAEEAEYNLFHNSCSANHCLRHIYTVNEKPGATRLRTRGHDFTLPFVKYNFNMKNFIVRALYNLECVLLVYHTVFHNVFYMF